jgi:hypothetical protein
MITRLIPMSLNAARRTRSAAVLRILFQQSIKHGGRPRVSHPCSFFLKSSPTCPFFPSQARQAPGQVRRANGLARSTLFGLPIARYNRRTNDKNENRRRTRLGHFAYKCTGARTRHLWLLRNNGFEAATAVGSKKSTPCVRPLHAAHLVLPSCYKCLKRRHLHAKEVRGFVESPALGRPM